MALLTRPADRLQAALDGGPVAPAVRAEVDTARSLAALAQRLPGPDQAFVDQLRGRLLTQARDVLAPRSTGAHGTDGRGARRPTPAGTRTLFVGPGLRLLAGAVGAVLAVLAVLGAAGRSALPGQGLYPVRQVLDRAEVALAGGDRARGVTLLDQAGRDIADAATLAAATPPVFQDVTTAVESATAAASEGRVALVTDFTRTQDPGSLLAVQRFVDRVSPDVDALAQLVPAEVDVEIAQLEGLLTDMRTAALQALAACATCGSAQQQARSQLSGLDGTATTAPTGTSPTPPTTPRSSGAGGPRSSETPSGGPVTSQRGPGPSVSVSSPGLVGSGTLSLGGGGVSPTLPGLTPTLPLPTITLTTTVPLPALPLPTSATCLLADCR